MKKFNKNYKKIYNLYTRVNINRKMFLYSDSKGSNLKDKLTVVAKSGATVTDRKLTDELLEFVEKSRDPIVLVWLGTCELTGQKGKFVSIKHCNYKHQNVKHTLDKYRVAIKNKES